MDNNARLAFDAYTQKIASLNGVRSATTCFTVEPSIAQTLENRIQEQAAYLQQINVMPVRDMQGEKIGMGASGPIASRTDTTVNERQTRTATDLENRHYHCRTTNYDTHVTYATLNTWSMFPDFQTRIRNHVVQQIARDRLTIGWNGTSVGTETDLTANPLLQDVNIGWLQHLRTGAPQRVMTGIKIGPGGDYANLDAAVFDAVHTGLEPWHRNAAGLRVHVGDQLLTDQYLGLLNAADRPTEYNAMSTVLVGRMIGGIPAIQVPFFPSRSLLITEPANLSFYWQVGSHRRNIIDRSTRDRIEDFLQCNETYVVEDMGAAALLDNILYPDGSGGWA